MAERFPIIEIVDYNNGISWRTTPDELKYWVDRLGLSETRRQMHEALDQAIDQAQKIGIIKEAQP